MKGILKNLRISAFESFLKQVCSSLEQSAQGNEWMQDTPAVAVTPALSSRRLAHRDKSLTLSALDE